MEAPVITLLNNDPIELRCGTLGRCSVSALTWKAEQHLVDWERPSRLSASTFADALFAACVAPARPPSAYSTLPELDRARLRRAVIAAAHERKTWRQLWGSHLTPDERLAAIFIWRHERGLNVRARLRERHRELQAHADAARERLALAVPGLDVEASMSGLSVALTDAMPTGADFGASMLPPGMENLVGHQHQITELIESFDSVRAPIRVFDEMQRLTGFVKPAFAFEESFSALHIFDDLRSPLLAASQQVASLLAEAVDDQLASPIARALADAQAARGIVARSLLPPHLLGLTDSPLPARFLPGLPAPALFTGLPTPSFLTDLRRLTEPFRELQAEIAAVELVAKHWEQRALWLLLARLGLRQVAKLSTLAPAEVEAVVLLAIELAICDGGLAAALREALGQAPLMTAEQREQLDHMLELAEQARWVLAAPMMYPALEGIFWQAAYANTIVTFERYYLDRNKKAEFENVVKLLVRRLDLDPMLGTLIVREVYGTTGNPYRHGGSDGDERGRVLYGIVALCAWLEEFADLPALDALCVELSHTLPPAISHVNRSGLRLVVGR